MPRILIVDDDEDFAHATGKVLHEDGYEVSIALDTESAFESIESAPPDLVILDVMFPEDSTAGFEFARDLSRKAGPEGQVPVLMLTAINQRFPLGFGSEDIDDSWLPVSDFLEKPVDFDRLLEKVSGLLT
jgi:DNA-binding response OmpR family regulator